MICPVGLGEWLPPPLPGPHSEPLAITAELGAPGSFLHPVERRLGQQVNLSFGLCLLDADPALLVACRHEHRHQCNNQHH